MILRRLAPGDWAAFRDIRLAMLRSDPTAYGSRYDDWAGKTRAEIEDWLERIHLFAAIDGGRCLASAGWHPEGTGVVAHRGHVICVYTRPEARGQGLMGRVLSALAEDAAAAGILQLELAVAEDGAAARAAYAAAGYVETGRIPRALRHDGRFRDVLCMVRALDGAGIA
ncbi:GNAT family N-acetyltransferase [Rhodobacterales bacterium HKCCE2091]|nr:GNAT family N-acetyltransferase [Rhodobacterales bacterium HKCCE2091]